ncbi:MAG TPA: tRNA pseudouridine(55) synthase TruB [Syntrophales bacterium]
MNGVIIVDKPAGITSHDVVDRVRKLLGIKKAGHAGTLDPMATGVLAVCVGEATKIASFLTGEDKVYEATMRLGVRTATQDMTGQVLAQQAARVTDEDVKAVLAAFVGTIDQVPPQYSAVKVRGKALYKWARKGVKVEPAARQVKIREILVGEIALPRVSFAVTCSKGTYVRTLCADMGDRLGCGAALESLRRTVSGIFREENAVSLGGESDTGIQARLERALIPTRQALPGIPDVLIPPSLEQRVMKGHQPDAEGLAGLQIASLAAGDVVKFVSETGRLVALATMLVQTEDVPSLEPFHQAASLLRVFNE